MLFDFSKLLGRIKEYGYTQTLMAKELGISDNAFTNKIKGRNYFTALEIAYMCKVLEIPSDMVGIYFFTPKVWKSNPLV